MVEIARSLAFLGVSVRDVLRYLGEIAPRSAAAAGRWAPRIKCCSAALALIAFGGGRVQRLAAVLAIAGLIFACGRNSAKLVAHGSARRLNFVTRIGLPSAGCSGIRDRASSARPVMKITGIGDREQIVWTASIPEPGFSSTSAVIKCGHLSRAAPLPRRGTLRNEGRETTGAKDLLDRHGD